MHSNLFLMLFCILSAFTLLTGCSSSSSSGSAYSATIAEGRAAVNDVMSETSATSISVALVDGDRVVWSEAFGSADRNAGQNSDTTTLFGICSASKMLATVATMILVDRGQVALDEPVTTYIRNFTMPLDARYRNITVRMLLNHTSGLSGNDMRGALTVDPFPGYAAQVMDGFRYQRLKHDPGVIGAYNNDGFTMVQNLVKSVTGQDYNDFVRQNILSPLGMNASRYQTESFPDGSFARPYSGNTRQATYFVNAYGSGGLYSTPEELSRLAIMFMNKGVYGSRRILSEQSVTAMAQDQRAGTFNPVPSENYRYGLGWDTMAQQGLAAVGITAWQKTGDMSGYYGANIVVAPEEKLAVVVFGASNSFSSESAVKISERIMLRALVERGRLAAMPSLLSTASLPTLPVTLSDKTTYTGFYASSNGIFRLTFGLDDSLTVDEFRDNWTPKFSNFRLRSDGWYAADGAPNTGLRLLTQGGRTYFAYRQRDGYGHYYMTAMFGQRLDTILSISAAWQTRLSEMWLPVNTDTRNLIMSQGNPGFQLRTITGLTGYFAGNNILRDMTPQSDYRLDGMFLYMADAVRDLQDAGIETWNGQNWLRLGSYLYRPQSGLALLASGASTITIGSDGFAEWRQLPASGSISISGTSRWFLYDAAYKELASGTSNGVPSFSGVGAKYLVLFAATGTTINLNLSP